MASQGRSSKPIWNHRFSLSCSAFGLFSLLFLLLSFWAFSTSLPVEKSMKLLAVSEAPNGSLRGSVADLSLTVRPGSGRVFIDTFPVTKMDTQLSTRFAKELACSISRRGCSSLDFFYTLRSSSPLIGGPSAGAAAALLTLSALDSLDLRDDVLVTGTINSGGIIGPVGGIKQKIDAAASAGASIIIVPENSAFYSSVSSRNLSANFSGNLSTLNLSAYASRKGMKLVEVATLEEAVFYATGSNYSSVSSVEPSDYYLSLMRSIAEEMCNRTSDLVAELKGDGAGHSASVPDYLQNSSLPNSSFVSSLYLSRAFNLSSEGFSLLSDGNFYSAASRCFGANIYLRSAIYLRSNLSVSELNRTLESIILFRDKLSAALFRVALRSVTDVQTFIVVDERIREAGRYISLASSALALNASSSAAYYSAYALERLYSARLWSRFFGLDTERVALDKSALKDSCMRKLSEAEERMQYVRTFLPFSLSETKADVDDAYKAYSDGNFELCLFRASKAKAKLDILASVLSVDSSQIDSLLDAKLNVAGQAIHRETSRGTFPILGYSYYEYALALRNSDKYSALLYSEYALELSNLELYFDVRHSRLPGHVFRISLLFFSAVLSGLLAGLSVCGRLCGKKRKVKKWN